MFRYLLVSFLLLAFGISSIETAFAGKKVAFLVGVNKYKKPGFSSLSYAERDVDQMSKELESLGFEVSKLTGKDATKTNLDTTIKKLVAPLSADDLILVMLAGHGQQKAKGDAFFCPYDAIISDDSTLFSLSKLLNETLAPNVGRKLLLIDACRNDPDPGRGRSAGIQGRRISLPEETVVMFSCRAGQQSFENDKLKQGIFTHCVLDALRGKAARNGKISWSSLQLHVMEKMASTEIKKYLPTGRKQTPIPAGGVPFTILGDMASRSFPRPPVILEGPTFLKVPFTKAQLDAKLKEWTYKSTTKKDFTNSIGMKFNLIPPGEFQMGSKNSEKELAEKYEINSPDFFKQEFPRHTVQISKPYYICTTEVTQKQWKNIMGTEPWKLAKPFKIEEHDNVPAVNMTWNDAQTFIRKLSEQDKVNYRLPTEAEWEFACRAGSDKTFFFGNDDKLAKSYAWFIPKNFDRNSIIRSPRLVAQKLPNHFGLFDIVGNAKEMCADWYSSDYYKTSPILDPKGPTTGETRVVRGGGWSSIGPRHFRSSNRFSVSPTRGRAMMADIGFRLVCSPEYGDNSTSDKSP